jgi:hypothetical protein
MARTRKTPRPQKSSAKAKAAVNKMKGAATTAPRPSDESDKAKVEVETVVWEADNMSVDDGAVTGRQSIMEAASAVVSLLGVATMITDVPANAPKKSKGKKPSPFKRKTPATKAKKPAPPSDDQVFWLHFSELCRYKADHSTTNVPGQQMVQTMYLRIGFIISGRYTQGIYLRMNIRVS